MTTVMPGVCRHCRCTDTNPCLLSNSDTCCWVDRTRLVCSNPTCIKAEQARKAQIEAARPKRLSSAEVSDAIRRGNRGSRGKRANRGGGRAGTVVVR